MLYENQPCPVCKRPFEEGDDIVYCPDCGTPHHRECYNLVGHCVNKGLHKTNYSYYEEHRAQESVKPEPEKAQAESNDNRSANSFFPPIGNGQPMFDFTKNAFDNDKSTIDGESIGDVAATVRSNTPRFINIFKKMEQSGKKASWNWGAFFFGAYYLFFRKMFKQAITLFCVNITLSSVMNLLVSRFAPKTVEAINELYKLMANGDTNTVINKLDSIRGLVDYSTFFIINITFMLAVIAIRICVAVFADKMYKDTVTDLIKKTNEQLNEGAAFSVPSLSAQEDSLQLSQEQMRRLYLSKRGGVSVWAPIAAYLIMQLIARLF